ncbi:MAG: glycosyltransferase [Acidobacteriota bacterium]|nr:glycosyltransferase [Acidobacteriota bacterium]
MTVLAVLLMALALSLAAWSYLAYPSIVRRLARRAASPVDVDPASTRSSVEVLVAAADEERVIADRVRDLLAQEVDAEYRISIGCDGSADRTAEKAREAGGSRVAVLEFPDRRGKASVLNDLVAGSSAEILVFTDANTRFEPGAIRALCRALERRGAGAACGRLILEAFEGDPGTPESAFWDRETDLKEAEGLLGVCLGANGAIYAARRHDVPRLPPDTTSMDDFLIPLGIARRGGAVVFAGDAVAREGAGRDARAETSRRFRIGVGAGQVLRREGWLWNAPRHPLLSLVFLSRKAARWLSPLFFLLSAGAALGSSALRPAGSAVLVLAALLTLWVRLRLPAPRGAAGALYYFAVINLALAAGVAAGLAGYSLPAWKAVARP